MGGDRSNKLYLNLDGRKYQIGNACSLIENKCYFCQHVWMTSKLHERCRIWVSCQRHSKKNVDVDKSTLFLDHSYLECIQRECKPNETIIEQCTKMVGSRISARATVKLPGGRNLTHIQWRGLMI